MHARLALSLAVVALAAGCLSDDGFPPTGPARAAIADCATAPVQAYTLYFGSGNSLVPIQPTQGAANGNAFSSGFLTNELREWLSAPVAEGLWLDGEVTLEYWVRSTGTPAPLVIGGDPGEGYHFFNQFGSDRTLQPGYATEYGPILPLPGTVDHYVESIPMPPGGFVVEAGDALRVILTDLALDGPAGSGHEVLFGGETPSQIRFTARCFPTLYWRHSELLVDVPVGLVGNQGLLTGAIPPTEGLNLQTVDLVIPEDVQRLSVRLTQDSDLNPVKDDIDLVLVQVGGNTTWSIGSPYSDEKGTLWEANLDAAFPNRLVQVQVNSYSGLLYQGRLVITGETATLD